jgi:hypothetical protein
VSEAKKNVSFARLVKWMEGRLPADESRTVEDAIAGGDRSTLADVAWLRRFFEATRDTVIESPPPEVGDALLATFVAHTRDRQAPGYLRRVLARLAFDSNLHPAAGLRAVGAQQARRQLVYNSDMVDLAVNLLAREADNNLDIDGQVLPRQEGEPELFSVQLLRDGDEIALTNIDELGGFSMRRVPPGSYEMILSADRLEVSVLPVDVSL